MLVVRLCAQFGCAHTGVTVYRLDELALLFPIAADAVSCADGLAPRPLGVGAAGLAAAQLDEPLGNVKGRIYLALDRLRATLTATPA